MKIKNTLSKIILLFSGFWILGFLPGCFPVSSDDPGDLTPASPLQFDYDSKIKLALGGVVPGWDRLQINDLGPTDAVELEIDPPDLASTQEIDATAESLTYRLTPLKPGVGKITYSVNGVLQNKIIKLVIPPQEMIQILLGEARSIIPQEVTVDDQGRVDRASRSFTAQALLSVVRNRIDLMVDQDAPELFVVDRDSFEAADQGGRYSLVIEANSGSVYQFSPVDPDDPSREAYDAGRVRTGLSGNRLLTYDQGVLTAADIFDEELSDNTLGSFGFYSPTQTQYQNLLSGIGQTELPDEVGSSDGQFPNLAPIQVRIFNEISPQAFDADLPSFVFVGSRSSNEEAVLQL